MNPHFWSVCNKSIMSMGKVHRCAGLQQSLLHTEFGLVINPI